jgi:hypothetical protein
VIVACASAWAGAWLVGVRNERGGLSTYWVDDDGVAQLGPGLAVPSDDGWWRLEPVRWSVVGFSEVALRWVAPDDTIHQPRFSAVRGSRWLGTSVVRVVGIDGDRWTTETALDVTTTAGVPLRQTTTRTEVWRPTDRGAPVADGPPVVVGPAVPISDARTLTVDAAGLHLAGADGGGVDVAVAGAALVWARPVPAGEEAAWRAAAGARLAVAR